MREVFGAVVVAILMLGCGVEPGRDPTAAQEGLQEAFVTGLRARVITVPPDGLDNDAFLLASTAAIVHYSSIQVPVGSGGTFVPQHGSCGATFLSPHFAVTAAHCVERVIGSAFTMPGEFFVDHLDVSGVAAGQVHTSAAVTGTWPNWSSGSSFVPPAGYVRSRTRCRVYCGRTTTGFTACTPATATVDVALIECPDRSASFRPFWVYAGNTQPVVGAQVQTFWYHEVLTLPTSGAPGNAQWDHYGSHADLNGINDSLDDNFHYTWPQLLWPLVSDTNAAGGPATITSAPARPGLTAASMLGCHGTSGAGVFARGSTALYGPADTGAFSTLCGDGLSAIHDLDVNDLQGRPRVANDRGGIYTRAF